MAFKFPHIWPFQPQLTSLSSVTHLPPATVASLLVREPHVHLAHKCPMAFAQADPSVWNALLPHITELTLFYAMLPQETQSVLVWCHGDYPWFKAEKHPFMEACRPCLLINQMKQLLAFKDNQTALRCIWCFSDFNQGAHFCVGQQIKVKLAVMGSLAHHVQGLVKVAGQDYLVKLLHIS